MGEQARQAATILLVDDEPRSLDAMEMALEETCEVRRALSAEEALEILSREKVALVISDQRMPGMSGVELLKRVRLHDPAVGRVIVSAYTDPEDMIAAINAAGIQRFIRKPWHPEELVETVCAIIDCHNENTDAFAELVHAPQSPLAPVIARARVLARHNVPVLVRGEPGAGHGLLASAMARAGGHGAFRSVSALDFAGLKEALAARGGLLHVRDLERCEPSVQAWLHDRLCSGEALPRLVASVGSEGEERLLPELFYQLAVERLALPPLRERPMDIPLLAEHYRRRAEKSHNVQTQGFSEEAMEALKAHAWPGNLRELESAVIRGVLFAEGGRITPQMLFPERDDVGINLPPPVAEVPEQVRGRGLLRERIAAYEAEIIRDALRRHNGNISRVARELGLSRVGLRAKMERYNLRGEQDAE